MHIRRQFEGKIGLTFQEAGVTSCSTFGTVLQRHNNEGRKQASTKEATTLFILLWWLYINPSLVTLVDPSIILHPPS